MPRFKHSRSLYLQISILKFDQHDRGLNRDMTSFLKLRIVIKFSASCGLMMEDADPKIHMIFKMLQGVYNFNADKIV